MIEIYNEDCFETMASVPIGQFDIILTSPFYNTNKKQVKHERLKIQPLRADSMIMSGTTRTSTV